MNGCHICLGDPIEVKSGSVIYACGKHTAREIEAFMSANQEKPSNPKDIISTSKVPLDMCPDTLRVAVAAAFTEGALKYGKTNWRVAGVRSSVYKAALDRHMCAYWNGEDVDAESGMPHLWKAAACLAILIDAGTCGMLTDDRPPRADLSGMLRSVEPIVKALQEKHKDKNPRHYTIADTP